VNKRQVGVVLREEAKSVVDLTHPVLRIDQSLLCDGLGWGGQVEVRTR
jgi:hypothetical protein